MDRLFRAAVHLPLFALVERIERAVRLVRSKGVGVFLVPQKPLDIPDKVLGQLGDRVQHALAESAARSAARSLGSSVGREILRGVLGGILGRKPRRR